MENEDHGRQQAAAQAESIERMVAAVKVDYDQLAELRDARDRYVGVNEQDTWCDALQDDCSELAQLEEAAGDCQSQDEASDRINEDPLSVEVRSNWVTTVDVMQAQEFRILLSTGGPHVEIKGDLDEHYQPERACLYYQDWGTPLTEYGPADEEALLEYARHFYYGT